LLLSFGSSVFKIKKREKDFKSFFQQVLQKKRKDPPAGNRTGQETGDEAGLLHCIKQETNMAQISSSTEFQKARKAKAEQATAKYLDPRHPDAEREPIKVVVPGHSWLVLSSDGYHYYPVQRTDWADCGFRCGCPYGTRSMPYTGQLCRHCKKILEEALNEGETDPRFMPKSEPKFIPVSDPSDDDPFSDLPTAQEPARLLTWKESILFFTDIEALDAKAS
jgi:hypothetical protein